MNPLKQSFICFVSLFFLLPLLQGCSNPEEIEGVGLQAVPPQKPPVHGGIYRIPLRGNPITLDPAYVQDNFGEFVVHQVFDGLVRFDPYLSILPALAETWEVKKGTRYTFKLRQDAVFHNQEPVTADDVCFSIQRLLRAEPPSAVLQHLLKIDGAVEYRNKTRDTLPGFQIESEKNFSIHLIKPHAPFLTALGMYQVSIVPENAVMRLGDTFGNNPVGSGPFRFVSWEDERAIQLHRFNAYYGGPARLDGIYFRIYPDGLNQAVLNDFKNSRLDEMTVFGNAQEALAGFKGLQWIHKPSMSLFFYGINIRYPHLEDPGLRNALSAVIDRQTLVNTVYGGKYQATQTILPPGMDGHQRFDPVKASYPSSSLQRQPLEIEIVSAGKSPRVKREIELIQRFWAPLNITIQTKYIMDWKQFTSYIRSDAVQIYRYGWHADLPDPDSFLSSLFSSDAAHNHMNLNDETIDVLLSDARGILDPIERTEIYRKIETRILAAAPIIPLFNMDTNRVYQPHVQSININAIGPHATKLNKIWLDKNLNK